MFFVQVIMLIGTTAYAAWLTRTLVVKTWEAGQRGEKFTGTEALQIVLQPATWLFDRFVVKPISDIADTRAQRSRKVRGK